MELLRNKNIKVQLLDPDYVGSGPNYETYERANTNEIRGLILKSKR